MKRMYKKVNENAIYITVLVFAVFGMFIYISQASSNVPIMDYWRFLNALADKSYMSGISFSDLYSNNGVHRTPAELYLFLVNIKFFHWNTQISMYVGTIVMAICATLFYITIKKNTISKIVLNIGIFLIILNVFSLGAYEIITQEFYTSFALRELAFIGGFLIMENILRKSDNSLNNNGVLMLLYNVFTICILGAAYSMAYSVSLIVMIMVDYIIKRKNSPDRMNFINYIVLFLGVVFGDVLYIYGLEISTTNSGENILSMAGSFVKGFIIMNGASLFGSEVSPNIIYIAGIMVIVLHVFAVLVYIKCGMFKKSYLPLNLYIYFIIFYGMIFVGRGGFGVGYLASARYIMDSCLALIADIIVFCMYFESHGENQLIKKISCFIGGCFVITGIVCTDYHEISIQNYRKIYADNLIQMMLDIDEYSDDELAVFQAGDPELVRSGVELMKKYQLGVFYYTD